MTTFLLWTESTISFFFLIRTLYRTLGYLEKPISPKASLILFSLLFTLIYKPLEILNGDFYLYCATMLLLGILYARLFTVGHFLQSLTVCITYIFCIISIRTLFYMAFEAAPASSPWNQGILYFPFYMLLFFCSLFFQFHPLRTSIHFPKKYWCCMILTPALISVSEDLYMRFVFGGFAYTPFAFSIFLLVFLIGITVYYLSYIITDTSNTLSEAQIINQKLASQLSHIERSASMVEQIYKDKHEMKNVYFYIQSLIKSHRMEELEEFVDSKLIHRLDLVEEFHTGNQLLDYLLAQKVNEAKDYDIHVMTNIQIPAKLSMDEDDLCGLLLNLIDNAIDASKNEDASNRDIHILIKKTKNFLEIVVKNKSEVNVLETNKALETTKKDARNHGFGMKIINSITKKYNGIKNMEMNAHYFVVSIVLQLP